MCERETEKQTQLMTLTHYLISYFVKFVSTVCYFHLLFSRMPLGKNAPEFQFFSSFFLKTINNVVGILILVVIF